MIVFLFAAEHVMCRHSDKEFRVTVSLVRPGGLKPVPAGLFLSADPRARNGFVVPARAEVRAVYGQSGCLTLREDHARAVEVANQTIETQNTGVL